MKSVAKSVICVLLLGLIPTPAAADTILHSVAVHTWTANGLERFTALVFDDDGKILATGGDELLRAYPEARRIDGGGGYVLPGLTDAHAHLYSLGFLANSLNLAGSPSLADATAKIAAFARRHPQHDWLLGRGWNQVLWPGKEFPRAADIDAVVADRPVWLQRIDGHAGWANSRALAIAGIDADTPDPRGGRIIRGQDGKPTGILVDNAMNLVQAHVPVPDKARIRAAYRAAIGTLLAQGMTGVHDAGIGMDEAQVYLSMADDDALQLRVYAMLSRNDDTLAQFEAPIVGYGNDHLDIRAVKIYSDGALGSRGAALLAPYSDDADNRGLPFWKTEQLVRFVEQANARGFQAAIHAIGDRGNRMALDAFEQAQRRRPSPLRNRIEHAQILSLDDISRFARLGVIASIQPTHATSDMNMAADRVGPERIKGGYAWRRLLDAGVNIAGGSDFPVELSNPFFGLYAAVTRQDRNGQPPDGWFSDQALTRAEALRAFTLDAAYAAHQEQRLGSLEPGKWADFIIIDRDYFGIPESEIDDIRVLETWIAGQRRYDANERETP